MAATEGKKYGPGMLQDCSRSNQIRETKVRLVLNEGSRWGAYFHVLQNSLRSQEPLARKASELIQLS